MRVDSSIPATDEMGRAVLFEVAIWRLRGQERLRLRLVPFLLFMLTLSGCMCVQVRDVKKKERETDEAR